MKALVYLAAGFLLLSFRNHKTNDDIDGIWMGYYRSDISKEKVIVKFNSEDRMEFYTGGINDQSQCVGSYRLLGDSISFSYKTPEGRQIEMRGHLNYRKTYLDGSWTGNDAAKGKFYLQKQKVEERMVAP